VNLDILVTLTFEDFFGSDVMEDIEEENDDAEEAEEEAEEEEEER